MFMDIIAAVLYLTPVIGIFVIALLLAALCVLGSMEIIEWAHGLGLAKAAEAEEGVELEPELTKPVVARR